MQTLQTFIAKVNREFGTEVELRRQLVDLGELPPVLRTFYAETDGLDLPFLELYPASEIRSSGVPGFLIFGSDRYFSFCLCSTDPDCDQSFDLWDHEGEEPPKGFLPDVLSLLVFVYQEFTENESRRCDLVIQSIPPDVKLALVVKQIKTVSGDTSAELLGKLRTLPIFLSVEPIARAIGIVRELQVLGVDCHTSVGT